MGKTFSLKPTCSESCFVRATNMVNFACVLCSKIQATKKYRTIFHRDSALSLCVCEDETIEFRASQNAHNTLLFVVVGAVVLLKVS